jgi:DNA polymerase-3 subunit delta
VQLRYEQLTAHLSKPLAPLYWLSGDVPFLLQESSDMIRNAATQQGYSERLVFHIDNHFSWDVFHQHVNTFSLFSNKQLIELRSNTATLGDAGKKALQNYVKKPAKDKLILLSTAKVDTQMQKAIWFQEINHAAIFIALWPITTDQLPQWIANRIAAKKLKMEPQAIALLATFGEGNLLAIAQEIEKLQLSYPETLITTEMMMAAIADNARFDVFQLSDAVLQNNPTRILRIIKNLQAEGTEAILVLWALTREIRVLLSIAHAISEGVAIEAALQQQRVWEKQKSPVRKTLQKHNVHSLQKLLQHAAKIDAIIKGVEPGSVWDELERLALGIAK